MERHQIRVEFESGDHIDTEINGTEEEIKAYYIGNVFNLGAGENDKMDTAVSVAFIEDPVTYTNLLNGRKASITIEDEGPKRCWQRIRLTDAADDSVTVTYKAIYNEACRLAAEWVSEL